MQLSVFQHHPFAMAAVTIVDYAEIKDQGQMWAAEGPPYFSKANAPSPTVWLYCTQSNDTVKDIANKFGFKVGDLTAVNTITVSLTTRLTPGMIILCPEPPKKGKSIQSDEFSDIDSQFFFGNNKGPQWFHQCCACENKHGLVTHMDYWDLKHCMICWTKRWTVNDVGSCTICSKTPPQDGWNGCDLCQSAECTVLLCTDCEKQYPFDTSDNKTLCMLHSSKQFNLNNRRAEPLPTGTFKIGIHNPAILFASLQPSRNKDRLIACEIAEQSIRTNELGFTKLDWFAEVQNFLKKDVKWQKQFLARRELQRKQQKLDFAVHQERARKVTKEMTWIEVAEKIVPTRSLKKLCKLCFICSQRTNTHMPCTDSTCLFVTENDQCKDRIFEWWLLSATIIGKWSSGDARTDYQLRARVDRSSLQCLGLFPHAALHTAKFQFLRRALAAVKESYVIETNNFAILSPKTEQPKTVTAAEARFSRSSANVVLPPGVERTLPNPLTDNEESEAGPVTAKRKSHSTSAAQGGAGKKPKATSSHARDAFEILLESEAETSEWASLSGEQLFTRLKDDPLMWREIPAETKQKNLEQVKKMMGFDFFMKSMEELSAVLHPLMVKNMKALMFKRTAQVYEANVKNLKSSDV